MKDAGDKLPGDIKAGITEKLEALKKVTWARATSSARGGAITSL